MRDEPVTAKFGPVTIIPKQLEHIDFTGFQPGDTVYIDKSLLHSLGPYPYTEIVKAIARAAGNAGVDWRLSEDHESGRLKLELDKIRPI